MKKQKLKRKLRHKRVRAKIFGTSSRPRLSVYRSSKYLFLQLIDDNKRKTLIGVSDKKIGTKKKMTKIDRAYEAGKMIARSAVELGIKEVVFDRGGYLYKGRVKKAADGAREGGLKF